MLQVQQQLLVNQMIEYYQEAKTYQQVQKIVSETLGFSLNHFVNSNLSIPLLNNTFNIWRRLSFSFIQKLPDYQTNMQKVHYNFYLLSELKYLKQFMRQIQYPRCTQEEIEASYCRFDQLNKHELLDLFNDLLWEHTIFCELFQSIVKLPYLHGVFNQNKSYKLKAQFLEISPILNQNNSGQILQKVGQNIIKKSFGQIIEKVFTKTFLIKASSVAIRLNPLAMAASFAFSQLLTSYRQDSKQKQMIAEVKSQIHRCYENLLILKQSFQIIMISLLPGVIMQKQADIELFKKKVLQVVEQDWLQIIDLSKDQEGWEVVILSGHPKDE